MAALFEKRIDFLKAESTQEMENLVNKVYFTCHIDDYATTYERIAKDLFYCTDNNCVIYSKVNIDEPIPEEKMEFIDDMLVIAVPVTRKLLTDTENNHALREIEYAISKDIIILPFMMDPDNSDLRKLYEESIFEKRQWVSPDFTGPDAIPYKDKLTRFCQEHFLDDKTINSIKAEFSSRIFFSYRQKDRKHAKPLMMKIHEHKELTDVAIWYDEYLPLAKDFSISIEREMDNSDAVIFLVTNNLIEGENYVKTVEYPMAKDRKDEKKILPMEPMGNQEIRRKVKEDFEKVRPGFPDYIELMDLPTRIDRKKTNDTPEHKYLIGLAYLYGVDVEKDVFRAVEMFISSAEEKYIPAAEKLRDMYSNGEGVPVDYDKALKWSDLTCRLYTESPDYGKDHPETLFAVAMKGMVYEKKGGAGISHRGNYIRRYTRDARRNLDNAAHTYHSTIDAMKKIGKDNTADFVTMVFALAEVYNQNENYASATRYFTEALALMYRLIRSNVINTAENLADTLPDIEFVYSENNDYNGQITHLLTNLEKVYESVKSLHLRCDYSDYILNISMGIWMFYVQMKYKMAISCGKSVCKMARITDNKHQLFLALGALGASYRGDGNYADAAKCLKEAYHLSIKIMGDANDDICLITLLQLGQAYLSGKKYSDAADCYEILLNSIPEDDMRPGNDPLYRGSIFSELNGIYAKWKSTVIKGTKQYKKIEDRIEKLGVIKFRI